MRHELATFLAARIPEAVDDWMRLVGPALGIGEWEWAELRESMRQADGAAGAIVALLLAPKAEVMQEQLQALKSAGATSYTLSTTHDERAVAVCRAQPGVGDARIHEGRVLFTADPAAVAELSQALVEAGALIKSLTPHSASLEELFFSLTEDDAAPPAESPEPLPRARVRISRFSKAPVSVFGTHLGLTLPNSQTKTPDFRGF